MTSFELLREHDIPEINSRARLYRHIRTGAEVLSLENDDENKVFGITFRTPPSDSTGVAHILEHSVLNGSRKYPLKEPFVELIKGSLQTFLNAMTYPDKTAYPVASQNMQDFYNLIDVYLDAVFYPRITRHIFEQEGWHYELEQIDDPLVFKGVVFNEMKGAFGYPDPVMAMHIQQSLFPDTIYGVESGGHPRFIPDLTYEQFKHFHTTFYHPSNARIYFYGDDDPAKRLEVVEEYLKDFERLPVESSVGLQHRFDAPRRSTHPFRVDEDSPDKDKGQVTVNWIVSESTDPQLVLAFHILEHILIGTPASPLRKALMDSGLGEDLAGFGYESELRQGIFSTGLKGIAVDDAEKVETLILDTLKTLAEQGIDPKTVEASLNTIEFRLRENNTGSYPRGLVVMMRALTSWLHDGDPFAPLAFTAPLTAIKEHLEQGKSYFESLIREFLLDNTHRTTVILTPDPELGRREDEDEKQRLARARAAMSEDELHALIENTRTLKKIQETPDPPEALALIPGLTLDDLDTHNKPIPITVLEQHGTRVLFHDLPTSDIVYLDVGLNLHMLPQELLPYAPLFGQALLEMGTEREDYVELLQRIGRKTGGISTKEMSSMVEGGQESAVWLFLRSKATKAQTADLLDILRDVLLSVRLDNKERFRQIVLEEKADQESSLVPGGHMVVLTRLSACFNEADWFDEQTDGVNYLFFLRQLLKDIDQDWPSVLDKLQQVRSILVNRNAMICNVTVDEANWSRFAPELESFLGALPATSVTPVQWSPNYSQGFEGLTVPVQVNYVGKGLNLYQRGYHYHGSAAAIIKYLRTTWLWERVRVQGGAYGAFCMLDRQSGVLTCLSYRDPNLLGTLDVYDRASEFLRTVDLNENEVTRSIIGAISDMDRYQLPDARGYTSMVRYLVNDSDEQRQRIRDEVLSTTVADFRAFADVLRQVAEHGVVVVLGSSTAIEASHAERGWMQRRIDVL